MEFIGTFFLVLTIAMTGNPIAIGAILIAMVYMGGYISGAHYNPAVTLAVLMRGKISVNTAITYMVVQIIAGGVAAFVFMVIKDATFVPTPSVGFVAATLTEILFTFALATVVLNVAMSKQTEGNDYYGLAIGLTVMAAAFAGGPISGGAYNPAVAIGPILVDMEHFSQNVAYLPIYLIGPFVGAVLAALVYRYTSRTIRAEKMK